MKVANWKTAGDNKYFMGERGRQYLAKPVQRNRFLLYILEDTGWKQLSPEEMTLGWCCKYVNYQESTPPLSFDIPIVNEGQV